MLVLELLHEVKLKQQDLLMFQHSACAWQRALEYDKSEIPCCDIQVMVWQ